MQHPDEEPEHAVPGVPAWLLAVGLVVVIVVALALLVGAMAADELSVVVPGWLPATWAAP